MSYAQWNTVFNVLINTGLQKKFPRINFQYSVNFSLVEYEYESHFFTSRLDFPKIYDKALKTTKHAVLDCVYVWVNQQIQYFAYLKCFFKNTFHPYVQNQV